MFWYREGDEVEELEEGEDVEMGNTGDKYVYDVSSSEKNKDFFYFYNLKTKFHSLCITIESFPLIRN